MPVLIPTELDTWEEGRVKLARILAKDFRKYGARPGTGLSSVDRATNVNAFNKMLKDCMDSNGGGYMYIPPGLWEVDAGLHYDITGHRFRNFGIICEGTIISKLSSSTTNVLEILVGTGSAAQVRHLTLDGLNIEGQGSSLLEQDGLYLACVNGSDGAMLCARLINLIVESCGRHGFHGQGDFFENDLAFCRFRGNRGRGTWLENGAGSGSPVVSSINILGCNFSENVSHGLRWETPVNDVYVKLCHFISNGDAGIAGVNGGQVAFCHFENNHTAKGSAAAGQGGAHINNFATLIGCVFKSSGASCKQTAGLVTTNVNNQAIIGGEIEASGGAPAPALVTLSSGGTAGRTFKIDNVTLAGGATFCNDTPVSNLVIDGHPFPINRTTNKTLAQQESGAHHTNFGASGAVTLTLPASPLPGTPYRAIVRAAQAFAFAANSGQTIRDAATTGTTITSSTIGDVVELEAQMTASCEWVVVRKQGAGWVVA